MNSTAKTAIALAVAIGAVIAAGLSLDAGDSTLALMCALVVATPGAYYGGVIRKRPELDEATQRRDYFMGLAAKLEAENEAWDKYSTKIENELKGRALPLGERPIFEQVGDSMHVEDMSVPPDLWRSELGVSIEGETASWYAERDPEGNPIIIVRPPRHLADTGTVSEPVETEAAA